MNASKRYELKNPVRLVTAASLFDGHDAAINIMRRILQAGGAEVIHLGHNRSVAEIVSAAIEEDAQAIALSSYQGGHNEYFKYMYDLLRERGAGHIKIFGGGGGVIVSREIKALQAYGIDRIYSPEDGRRMGLTGIIDDILERVDVELAGDLPADVISKVEAGDINAISRLITAVEAHVEGRVPMDEAVYQSILDAFEASPSPVVGITGTGGAGKSSFTDELVRRYRSDYSGAEDTRTIAVVSVDPTRKRTGGALLGDRIRMNAIHGDGCYMRSLATRDSRSELSAATREAIGVCQLAGFDLIIVETSGIGQGSVGITELTDLSLYVMTPEYGAASQLEKIDMLDFADVVVLNKFERRGAEDALRDIRKQVRRNSEAFATPDEDLPVFGTIAAQWGDPGVDACYRHLLSLLAAETEREWPSGVVDPGTRASPPRRRIIPPEKGRYLGEIATSNRAYLVWASGQAEVAERLQALHIAAAQLPEDARAPLLAAAESAEQDLAPESRAILDGWDANLARYRADEFVYKVRSREIRQPMYVESLSKLKIPRVAMPRYRSQGDQLEWALTENVPGEFPYTAGVFPLKRAAEDPKRMFAGEGGPGRTNQRFHFLCEGETAHRLSTAFDSVTLYGQDPDERPDIYGKVGESGVSVPHLDDMKILYSGFDLCAPTTSVSMTINGPAPILLAMFLNTAIDQQIDQHTAAHGAPDDATRQQLADATLKRVRGTVQADILKEDQAQNTCIFSTDFSLKLMGDIQEYFIEKGVRNYYSVSISGYHIAEAGANPISQLAFTLSNGFTYVEYYLSRGMKIDDFAPNLSFFFSNGLDPEYTVLGRVARRIWSVALKRRYGASERSQKLKYHIQTSGRSLHAREIQFNDIRTTLQALLALYDNCNSLHTNAYDEAVTTPTQESVRRAMAIQMILNKEFGLLNNENALQGSFIVDHLTDLVEEAVLGEFERISERGGVLGAMETQYQRGKIQDESLYYEHRKHSGELPIIGVNTFEDPTTLADDWEPPEPELTRASSEEKHAQIASLRRFQAAHADETQAALERLKVVARQGGNLFAELMTAVRVASLGQITSALYEVGGEYRRNL